MKIIVINKIGSLFLVLLWIPFSGWSQDDKEIRIILVDFNEEEGLNTQPNPAEEFVNEQFPPLENEEPEIFDTMVKAVFRQPTTAKTITTAADNWHPGLNLWEVQLKEISWRRKFLVLW